MYLKKAWHWTIAPLSFPKKKCYFDQLWCLKYLCFLAKKGKIRLDTNKIIKSTNYLGKQKCNVTQIHREHVKKNIRTEISLMPQLHALLWSTNNLWHKTYIRFWIRKKTNLQLVILYYNIGLNTSLINLQDCIEDVNYNHHSFPNAGTAVSSRIII